MSALRTAAGFSAVVRVARGAREIVWLSLSLHLPLRGRGTSWHDFPNGTLMAAPGLLTPLVIKGCVIYGQF